MGYLDTGRGQPKAICPIKGPLVRDLFELYLSGQHSLRSIHQEMCRLGLRGHGGKPVSLHGIEKMLSNTFYHGLITIERTGETFDGQHEPLISRAQLQKIQRIKSRRCGPKVTRHNHRFQGVFRCGQCGGPMVPERQKRHVYYRCQPRSCPVHSVREDLVESFILQKLLAMEFSPGAVRAMKKRWQQDDLLADIEKSRRSLSARIEAIETKLSRATDLLIDGSLESADYDAKKAELSFEVAQLRGQLDDLPDAKHLAATRNAHLELFSNLQKTYLAASTAERRALLRNLFSKRLLNTRNVLLEEADRPLLLAPTCTKKQEFA